MMTTSRAYGQAGLGRVGCYREWWSLPTMPDKKSENGSPKPEASFGSGLGSDFKPLGKRILIEPRQNQRKPVARVRVDLRKSNTDKP